MAKFIEWSGELSVGIEEIDEQHKVLVDLVNEMHFLKIWLTRHIMESDQKYSQFFVDAGARTKLKKKSWVSRLWRG